MEDIPKPCELKYFSFFIHSFIHSLLPLFLHSFIPLFLHSFRYVLAHHLLHGTPIGSVSASSNSSSRVGVRLMLNAVNAGNVDALLHVGIDLLFHDETKSVFKNCFEGADDNRKGIEFLKRAVKKKNAEAAFLLGHVYSEGLAGLKLDDTVAETYFERSRALGLKF